MIRLKSDFGKFILFVLYFITSGCIAQTDSPVSGKIDMKAGWKPMVYLVQPKVFNEIATDYRGLVLDSAKVNSDGTFAFSRQYLKDGSHLYILNIQRPEGRFANHLADEVPLAANYMPLVIDKAQPLRVFTIADSFQFSFSIEQPGTDNIALMSLRDIRNKAHEVFTQQMALVEKDNDTLLLEKESHYLNYAKSMMNFADTTSSLPAALVAIRWISAAGDYERIPEFIQRQCNRWNAHSPQNSFANDLCALTTQGLLPVMIGDAIPDFEMPLNSGDTTNLYSLLGKKLTLLDIWASWCAPCRKENRQYLGPLYKAYKEQGLQIIGYSIDHDASSWTDAIIKDQAGWVQASHLTGDATPFLEAIRISTIPANFILDAKGRVIGKNLYGEALNDFISKYFQ